MLEPGDEPERGQVGLAPDGFVASGQRDEERRPAEHVPAETQIEPADGADPSRLEWLLGLGLADVHEKQSAGVLPFVECLAVDRHLERVASGQLALGDVGLDLSDAASRFVRVAAEAVDLAADRDLLVEMIVPLALEAGDLGLEARLLDQALVAGCDRLGETELIGLRSDVFDPPDRRIAGHGHVDEARLALERLPAGGVDASLGRIGEERDLVVLVALALDPAFALGDLGREPRHIEMVERDEPSVGVDAGPHGLGRADRGSASCRRSCR